MKETTSGWLSQLTKRKWHSCAGWSWVYEVVHLPTIEPSTEQMQIFKVLIGTSCLCWKGNDILLIKTILTVGSPNRVSRCELRDGIISAPFIKVGPVYLLLNKVWKEDWNSFFFSFFFEYSGSLPVAVFKKKHMLSCSFVAAVDDKQKKKRFHWD